MGVWTKLLPNLVTTLRMIAAPLILWRMAEQDYGLAFAFLAFAGLSDAVDGWLARRLKGKSRLGLWLDPVADKTVILFALWALTFAQATPLWLAAAVSAREAILLLCFATVGRSLPDGLLLPAFVGKLYIVFAFLLALWATAWLALQGEVGDETALSGIHLLAVLTLAAGLSSLLLYAARWLKSGGLDRKQHA